MVYLNQSNLITNLWVYSAMYFEICPHFLFLHQMYLTFNIIRKMFLSTKFGDEKMILFVVDGGIFLTSTHIKTNIVFVFHKVYQYLRNKMKVLGKKILSVQRKLFCI